MPVLGIDIGGSGIKGALVDVSSGELASARFRLPTPEGAEPVDVAKVVEELVGHFENTNPVGCGFPAVVLNGVVETAANIHPNWIGVNAESLFKKYSGCAMYVLNDADAAGMAEMSFGAGKDADQGVVLMLTLGTGIGSAIFVDGHLVPNTELGHLEIRGKDAERRASDAARQRKNMSWEEWAKRFQEYLSVVEALLWPEVIILGGGASKDWEKFAPFLQTRAKLVPAQLLNQAGIVGAAVYAHEKSK